MNTRRLNHRVPLALAATVTVWLLAPPGDTCHAKATNGCHPDPEESQDIAGAQNHDAPAIACNSCSLSQGTDVIEDSSNDQLKEALLHCLSCLENKDALIVQATYDYILHVGRYLVNSNDEESIDRFIEMLWDDDILVRFTGAQVLSSFGDVHIKRQIDNKLISSEHGTPIPDSATWYFNHVKSINDSCPLITSKGVIFPSGCLAPLERIVVSVHAFEDAFITSDKMTITFIFDDSGSMTKVIKGTNESQLDRLWMAFISSLYMFPAEARYIIDTFHDVMASIPGHPVGSQHLGKDEFVELLTKAKEKIDEAKKGVGATYLWKNIDDAVADADEGGVVVIYTDGMSDIHSTGTGPEESNKDELIDNILRTLAEKPGMSLVISGPPEVVEKIRDSDIGEAVNRIRQLDPGASMPANVHFSPIARSDDGQIDVSSMESVFKGIAENLILNAPNGICYRVDLEHSGVVKSIHRGKVSRSHFWGLDSDLQDAIWDALVSEGYMDEGGMVQPRFSGDRYGFELESLEASEPVKDMIFNTLERARTCTVPSDITGSDEVFTVVGGISLDSSGSIKLEDSIHLVSKGNAGHPLVVSDVGSHSLHDTAKYVYETVKKPIEPTPNKHVVVGMLADQSLSMAIHNMNKSGGTTSQIQAVQLHDLKWALQRLCSGLILSNDGIHISLNSFYGWMFDKHVEVPPTRKLQDLSYVIDKMFGFMGTSGQYNLHEYVVDPQLPDGSNLVVVSDLRYYDKPDKEDEIKATANSKGLSIYQVDYEKDITSEIEDVFWGIEYKTNSGVHPEVVVELPRREALELKVGDMILEVPTAQ